MPSTKYCPLRSRSLRWRRSRIALTFGLLRLAISSGARLIASPLGVLCVVIGMLLLCYNDVRVPHDHAHAKGRGVCPRPARNKIAVGVYCRPRPIGFLMQNLAIQAAENW